MGCLTGLLIGDSIGYPISTVGVVASTDVQTNTRWELASFIVHWYSTMNWQPGERMGPRRPLTECVCTFGYETERNYLKLHSGQWTGHGIAALNMADSLLKNKGFDGADLRLQMWSSHVRALNSPYNSARTHCHLQSELFYLGMPKQACERWVESMRPGEHPAPNYTGGNSADSVGHVGSLTRLGPLVLHHYHSDCSHLEADARASSYTTQTSECAAHASAFVAYLLVAAMQRFDAPSACNEDDEHEGCTLDTLRRSAAPNPDEDSRAEADGGVVCESLGFLSDIAEEYEERLGQREASIDVLADPSTRCAIHSLRRLLRASEPEGSQDQCWNWRAPHLVFSASVTTAKGRHTDSGRRATVFGANCLDGLAMALHAIATTTSYAGAIERCTNMLGAANSTGALCGQIAGAMYGYRAIQPELRSCLHQFDDGHAALRAALLIRRATSDEQTSKAPMKHEEITTTARSQCASPFIATASGVPSTLTPPVVALSASSTEVEAPDAQLVCRKAGGTEEGDANARDGVPDLYCAERDGVALSASSTEVEALDAQLVCRKAGGVVEGDANACDGVPDLYCTERDGSATCAATSPSMEGAVEGAPDAHSPDAQWRLLALGIDCVTATARYLTKQPADEPSAQQLTASQAGVLGQTEQDAAAECTHRHPLAEQPAITTASMCPPQKPQRQCSILGGLLPMACNVSKRSS